MPSESFMPEFHQINEFNFDSAFVNSGYGNDSGLCRARPDRMSDDS
jgi:hypothetical protein